MYTVQREHVRKVIKLRCNIMSVYGKIYPSSPILAGVIILSI